jgi:hypothetical protein
VADGGNRLVGIREMAHDLQNAWVEPKVFWGPAAGNDQRVIIARANLIESRIQREVMTPLLTISLVPLEIVDRCPYRIARPLIRTDGMNGMPHHKQRLERNHNFVIFNVIANQHEQFLASHDEFSPLTYRRTSPLDSLKGSPCQ